MPGASVKTRVIRIGNSQGIRIPKLLLEQAGLGEAVELEAQQGQLVVRAAHASRQGWEEAFRAMAEQEDDQLLDPQAPDATAWDADEWEW